MNNDLISRSALLDAMCKQCRGIYPSCDGACKAKEAVVFVPAAGAELVRHGEWNLLPADIWDAYECSVCKKVETHPSRFCPNCGAQMNLEKND